MAGGWRHHHRSGQLICQRGAVEDDHWCGEPRLLPVTGDPSVSVMDADPERAFIAAFEACTLPRENWTHIAHVRMAWYYLRQDASAAALRRICTGIQRYNASVGSQGYHETVTQAYAFLIQECLTRPGMRALSWEQFAAAFPALFDRSAPPLLRYYRAETLGSPEARRVFVAPDLMPLPGSDPQPRHHQDKA